MINQLQETDLFKGVSADDLEKLSESYINIKSYKKDEFIFRIGEEPKHMYILLDGGVTVYRDSMDGSREYLKTFENPGTLFGEVYLYLEDKLYDFSCVCTENTTIALIDPDIFEDIVNMTDESIKPVVKNYIEILTSKISYFNTKIRIMSGSNLRSKLARYLLENEENSYVNLTLTREELADYLASTRPSISRELNNMKRDGLISIDKKGIKISKEKLITFY